jgi:hypothetical protein
MRKFVSFKSTCAFAAFHVPRSKRWSLSQGKMAQTSASIIERIDRRFLSDFGL